MLLRHTIVMFSLLGPLVDAASAAPESAIERAKQASAENRFQVAIEILDEAIRKDDSLADAYRERAWAKSCLGKTTEALNDSDRAIRLDAQSSANWHTRALIKINRQQDYEGAIRDLEAASKLAPNDCGHINVRGFCKLQLRRHEEAIMEFDRVVQLKPDFANARQLRGECHYSLGRYARALEDYEMGLSLEAKPTPRQFYTTGECYYQLKEYRKAIPYFQKALCGDKDDDWCYSSIGHCHYALGEYENALRNYLRVVELKPGDGSGHYCCGLALEKLGRDDEAAKAFARGLDLGYVAEK